MTGMTSPLQRVPGLAELAATQLGIVHRDQLRALDVSSDHVDSQVTAQRWIAWTPTVVGLMTGVPTREQWMWVAHLHCGPVSRIAGRTALELRGLTGWYDEQIHVLVPHGTRPEEVSGVVIHQSRRTPADVTTVDGLPCQSAADAVVLAGSLERSRRAAAGLVLAVVQQGLTDGQQVHGSLAQTYRLRNTAQMRAASLDAREGADSASEAEAARLVVRAGLPRPRRQVVIRTTEGERRVDLAVELPDGTVLVIEIDGVHHADPRQQAQDLAKDAALIAAGYLVLRITALMVRTDPGGVLRQLVTVREAAQRRSGGL